jgi:hypothetical protein
MSDSPALNEMEVEAREELLALASAMLDGKVSFFEGAAEILRLKSKVGGVSDCDPDFDAFVVIQSGTDHLPLQAQRPLWNADALVELQSQYERTEIWAADFAPAACRVLIGRFGRAHTPGREDG